MKIRISKKPSYENAYGIWQVTTDEGQNVKHLGVFEGYLDDIAFALADRCQFSLQFRKISPQKIDDTVIPTSSTVNVSLDIDSETWDLNSAELVSRFNELLQDRNVSVASGNTFASVLLSTTRETIQEKRAKVLNKLSEEEKEILGLNECE